MRKFMLLLSVIVITMTISTVSALPEILDMFNTNYNTLGTKLDSCDTCHISNKPQKPLCDEACHIPNKPQKEADGLNPYGESLKNNLNIQINQAFAKIENLDADGDKFNNIEEIRNLTFPGIKNDKPRKMGLNIFSNINISELLKNN